jgi:hypothetical protein
MERAIEQALGGVLGAGGHGERAVEEILHRAGLGGDTGGGRAADFVGIAGLTRIHGLARLDRGAGGTKDFDFLGLAVDEVPAVQLLAVAWHRLPLTVKMSWKGLRLLVGSSTSGTR